MELIWRKLSLAEYKCRKNGSRAPLKFHRQHKRAKKRQEKVEKVLIVPVWFSKGQSFSAWLYRFKHTHTHARKHTHTHTHVRGDQAYQPFCKNIYTVNPLLHLRGHSL